MLITFLRRLQATGKASSLKKPPAWAYQLGERDEGRVLQVVSKVTGESEIEKRHTSAQVATQNYYALHFLHDFLAHRSFRPILEEAGVELKGTIEVERPYDLDGENYRTIDPRGYALFETPEQKSFVPPSVRRTRMEDFLIWQTLLVNALNTSTYEVSHTSVMSFFHRPMFQVTYVTITLPEGERHHYGGLSHIELILSPVNLVLLTKGRLFLADPR